MITLSIKMDLLVMTLDKKPTIVYVHLHVSIRTHILYIAMYNICVHCPVKHK